MTSEWYHLSPVVLTDEIFFSFVDNCFFTGTAAQRQAAYLWAEQKFNEFAGAPILETTITGTFHSPFPTTRFILPETWIRSISSVVAITRENRCNCDLTRRDACGVMIDNQYGYIDMFKLQNVLKQVCGCCGGNAIWPFQLEVVYTSGFATGTIANDTTLHSSLAMAAQINLNEIVDPAANEGGPGDPGIESYSTLGYSEKRRGAKDTPWGWSARANMVARNLRKYRKPRRTLRVSSGRGKGP